MLYNTQHIKLTSPGAVKRHVAFGSHPPREGCVQGSITTQLTPSPDQPGLQVHVNLPGPWYVQFAYYFITL